MAREHARRLRWCVLFASALLVPLLLLLILPSAPSAATTVVTLGFDDGQTTQSQVGPMLASHGMHGIFYINSGEVGTSSYYLKWNQIHDLAAGGSEIGGHTLTHPNLPDLTTEQQRTQICDDRQNLLSQGFSPVVSFAYPYAHYTATTKQLVQECGYTTGRNVGKAGCCG